jgi:2-aminoethylphosphonate dioxygenase
MIGYQLNAEQIGQYHTEGFLLVRAEEHTLVEPTKLQAWTNEVRSWPRERGKWMPYDEVNAQGEKQLMRTECFVDYHAELKKLLCGEELLSILGQLAGNVRKLFPHDLAQF